jgi:hypothetical protein
MMFCFHCASLSEWENSTIHSYDDKKKIFILNSYNEYRFCIEKLKIAMDKIHRTILEFGEIVVVGSGCKLKSENKSNAKNNT